MHHIGDIIYQDLEQELIPQTIFHVSKWQMTELQLEGELMDVEIDGEIVTKRIGGALDVSGKTHHRKLCIELGKIDWRNELIVRDLQEDMEEGRHILMLTHSVEHTRILGGMIQQLFPTTGIVNGEDVDPFDRIPIIEDCNPVVATFDLAREALDKDVLDTLVICTPFGNANDLQQSYGRIQRRRPGKNEARVRVYEDRILGPDPLPGKKRKEIKMSANQCRILKTYLKALKYPYKEAKEKVT
jgi:hypothetical protein